MAEIELQYESPEALQESVGDLKVADLFTRQGEEGPLVLQGIKGMKTEDDVSKLSEALQKERNDHKQSREKLQPWQSLGKDPNEIQKALDELEELRVKVETIGDQTDLEEKATQLAEGRLKRELAPVQRERDQLRQQVEEAQGSINELQQTIKVNKLRSVLTDAAMKAKVQESAVGDAVIIGLSEFDIDEDGKIIHKETGLEPEAWFVDQRERRPHWWPASVGGGAKGGGPTGPGGKNPWSADNWNLTEQGRYIQENGVEKARKLAEAAGSQVGATRPPQPKSER